MTKLEQSPKTTKWTERLDDPARVVGETTQGDDDRRSRRNRMIAIGAIGAVVAVGSTFAGISFNKAQEFNATVNAQETAAPTDITSQNPEVIEPLVQTDHRAYPLEGLDASKDYDTFVAENRLEDGNFGQKLANIMEKGANVRLSPEEYAKWEQYAEETAPMRGAEYYKGAGLGAQLFADTVITPKLRDALLADVVPVDNYNPGSVVHTPEAFFDDVVGPLVANAQRNIAISQEKGYPPYEVSVTLVDENQEDMTIPNYEELDLSKNPIKVGQFSNIKIDVADSTPASGPIDNNMGQIKSHLELYSVLTVADRDTNDLALHDVPYTLEYGEAGN